MKNKILILSDLHFKDSGKSTEVSGIVRQNNSQAKATFEKIIPKLKKIKPDLIVNLGDNLSDSYVKEIDAKNLNNAIKLTHEIDAPIINLLGNHELQAFSYDEVSKIFNSHNKSSKFFGILNLNEVQIIWLDLLLDENRRAYLTAERLEWLNSEGDKEKPTIVFTHYSLQPINSTGSCYFENDPEGMYYKNFNEINETVNNFNIKLCINAHVHLFSHQEINNTHYISNPAFSENIAAEKFVENNPGVYSILEIDENNFVFTSHSGSFCFAKIQGKLEY